MISQVDIFLRLLLATLLGGMIGMERESVNRPAGFRTHILVCLGSTLMMIVSINIFYSVQGLTNADPGRIAAQVVSGIGFLGAGTILKEGATIKGLTTAASLWTVAGIGLAVGAGFYFGAIVTTIILFITLIFLGRTQRWLRKSKQFLELTLLIADVPGMLGLIGSVIGSYDISIRSVELTDDDSTAGEKVVVNLFLRVPANLDLNALLSDLKAIPGVYHLESSGKGESA